MTEIVSKQIEIDHEGQDPRDRLKDAIAELSEWIAATPPGPHRANLEEAQHKAYVQLGRASKTTGVVRRLVR